MEIRILGSLDVLADGREVPLGGARQRAVLAILLVHRAEVVPVDRIVDELWGGRSPETATKTVQVYVSRLRKALGEGALITRGGGYALELGADELDADRFERLAAEGRAAQERGDPGAAAQSLRAALALWRGPPLADFTYESFAQNEIARLEEERLAALEDRVEADLALGRHAALVGELESLAGQYPARERLRAQLMLALYRSGRQADALASYRDARRSLEEELGLEPGPELQRLERAILAQDPEIGAPARARPVAEQHRRRRGGVLMAFGGGLLLAAAVAAIVAADGGEDARAAEANTLAVIDPESGEVVATVPVGIEPTSVSADAESVWVANRGDDTVTRIDPETQTVVGTTPGGTSVGGLAAGAGSVWIGDSRGEKLVRLEPEFGSTRSIRIAGGPSAFDLGLNEIAVGSGAVWAGEAPGGIARIDPRSDRVIAEVPVGNGLSAITTGFDRVWAVDGVDNTLTRIDPESANAVTATVPVGQGPGGVAAGEGAVWVANTQDDTVSRVDPETGSVTETIGVGARPTGIAAGAGSVWVANSLDGTLSRIDAATNEVAATVAVGEAPQEVVLAHDRVWTSVQESAAAPEAPAIEAEDDVARVLAAADPGSPDPALTNDLDDYQHLGATCALLFNYPDRPFPVGARLVPEVATGPPSVSADQGTYTFSLRDDFRFSPPSDEPVTAAAFERAIERVLDPAMGSYGRVLARDIVGARDYADGRAPSVAGVTARGDTLTIELERPAGNLVNRLSTPWFCAVPPDTPVDRDGVDLLPSAGPYYVASYAAGRSLVLRRNPNYGGTRPQELEEIRYELDVSSERAIEQIEAGEADYAALDPLVDTAPPPEELRRLTVAYGPRSEAARAGGQQLFTQPVPLLHYFIFNADRDAFADPQLRRAVNYALDRRALAVDPGLGQRGRPTDQYIPPGTPGFEDETIYPLSGPDLATARRLAGDEERRVVLYTCDLPGCTRHAQILTSNLAAIGIEVDVRQFPLGQFFDRIQTTEEPWDITYWNWLFDYPDPATFINDQFGVGQAQLSSVIDDPAIQRRMADSALLSGDKRLRAYAQLDRDIAEQAVPAAPFASGTMTHLFSVRMGCQVLHPVFVVDLAALCIDDEGESG